MSKNNKKKYKDMDRQREKLIHESQKELKNYKEKMRAIELSTRSVCSHRSSAGKAKLELKEGSTMVKCKICGMKFDMGVMDRGRLKSAKKTVIGMCEQIRMMCDPEEQNTLKKLTKLEMDLVDIINVYETIVDKKLNKDSGDKKKHKNKDRVSAVGKGYRA